MASDLVAFFKFLSLLSAGFFGVLALLTEYKDRETKKITFWGKVALSGVICSTVVGATSQAIERHLDAQRAEKQAKQYRETLREISRAVMPLEPRLVRLYFRVPSDMADTRKNPFILQWQGRELSSQELMRSLMIRVRLVKDPLDDGAVQRLGQGPGSPDDDFSFWVRASGDVPGNIQGVAPQPLGVSSEFKIDPDAIWASNGRIMALPDLPGARS